MVCESEDGWLCTCECCDFADWTAETWNCCFLMWICGACLVFPWCTK